MYDLILRDATLVSSKGRLVADVAIKKGKIAYVGPRPPRKAKEEIGAIGKFLMPGVIDTAAQFSPNTNKRQWLHESKAAVTGGVTTVLSTPWGKHSIVDINTARKAAESIKKSWCNFAFWGAATGSNVAALDEAYDEGLIVGVMARIGSGDNCLPVSFVENHLKGEPRLGVQNVDGQALCEEITNLLKKAKQINKGMHLVHLSTAAELCNIDPMHGILPATASVTPHHLMLSDTDGLQVNSSPPVRSEQDRRTLWTAVKRGRLDCVASSHSVLKGEIPGSELLFPLMLSAVKYGRLSLELLVSLCSETPARLFNLPGKGVIEKGADADLVLFSEGEVMRIQQSDLISEANWSPFVKKESAPKPDLVLVAGQIVARRGHFVGTKPGGVALLTPAISLAK